jgi:pyrroloquinoline quinone (PQQ) biosynthesis protein C
VNHPARRLVTTAVTQVQDSDAQLSPPVQSAPRSARRDRLAATPHPPWAAEMLERLRPAWGGVLDSPLFTSTQPGALPEDAWRRTILEFFCVVESFPKYMGLTLAKTTFGRSPRDELARTWLIGNIKVEARHAEWYLDWGAGHGISRAEITGYRPHAAVAGLDAWLWAVAYRGTLAEAVGAINYAIEGTTGEWTRHVLPAFTERYDHDKTALTWLANHAEYDDEHPVQALEIVKNALSADGEPAAELVGRTESAIQRSLELFRAGFDYCFTG